ncbi:MAG TPA: J domain-containing protein [Terracidiphilus sp.]|nr:J domain-containing protein [Terracidiphilus sp.]
MPCACDRCRQHATVLGLAQRALTRVALRKAFLAAAKQWHPDRFERDPTQRLAAEEHFKLVQVAYRELLEHLKRPERASSGSGSGSGPGSGPGSGSGPGPGPPPDAPPPPSAPQQPPLPPIFFGDAPGCFVAPRFPHTVREIVAAHLQDTERAVAFLDLTAAPTRPGDLSQYLLLTSYRLFFRDRMGIVSLLWYVDLGEILLTEPQKDRKSGLRQRIRARFSRVQHAYTLEIRRHTGQPFCTLAGQADDTVKKVVYNFLRQVKPASHA